MSKRVTATRVGCEPIPGYTLRKRLGAGGYGEVWLADAPGGLQKAVKLIYGSIDETHASSELRSLQRIRQVYHPFLLSLERIEVVSGQVVIVTELAESSLLDRFESSRRQGLPGVPRATLLDFLRDTADALDFLAQKHSLQHLDVKPGNLLIIADRIKVADFGLVKDLHEMDQSLVGGLTPNYSAPEVFDGRPDFRSDQYSLAIVFMEMLCGRLPFDGKTAGELARQHLNQTPNLDPLPPADRNIVRRALSKNPLDRYSSCRQFVEQLLKVRSAVLPVSEGLDRPIESGDSTDNAATITTDTQDCANAAELQRVHEAISVHQLEKEWVNPRAMFVGLGGHGVKSLVELRRELNCNCDNRFTSDDYGWLAIDTSLEELEIAVAEQQDVNLPMDCALELPVHPPRDYRKFAPELFTPISRRWLYNIPKSLRTEGVRPIAVLSLLANYRFVRDTLAKKLLALIKQHDQDQQCHSPLRVYLLSSLHGGTGSGILCEIGMMIRQVFADMGYTNYRICAVASVATTTNSQHANLPAANAIAAISELSFLMNPENEWQRIFHQDSRDNSNQRPFDWVTLVDGGLQGDRSGAAQGVRNIAKVVALDSQSLVGPALAESRLSYADVPMPWLRTAIAAPIQFSSNLTPGLLARWCCEQSLLHTVQYMRGSRGLATSLSSSLQTPARNVGSSLDQLPLTEEACQEFTRRLLRELGVVKAESVLIRGNLEDENALLISQWARRLSNSDEHREVQLKHDLTTWQRSLARVVEMRVYNWRQVERIQLNVIEGILDYAENETHQLVDVFAPFSDLLGAPDTMLERSQVYLREFTERCAQLFAYLQKQGKLLGQKLQTWSESIEAEKALNEKNVEVNLMGLPPRMQLLVGRVSTILETRLQRVVLDLLDGGAKELGIHLDVDTDDSSPLSFESLVQMSHELVTQLASELRIGLEEFNASDAADQGVSLGELKQFVPQQAQGGGELYRLVVVPVDQMSMVEEILKKEEMRRTTTILPSTQSLGTQVYCEATGLNLPAIISSLWRPSNSTLALVERLRSRVDIEWDAATRLLDRTFEGQLIDTKAKIETSTEGTVEPLTFDTADALNISTSTQALPDV